MILVENYAIFSDTAVLKQSVHRSRKVVIPKYLLFYSN